MAEKKAGLEGSATIRCAQCGTTSTIPGSASRLDCRSCRTTWVFRPCGTCDLIYQGQSRVSASDQVVCPWCGSRVKILPFGFGLPTASAAAFVKQVIGRGVDYTRGDVLITGLTVVGGYGLAPPAGTKVTIGVCSDRLTVASVPFKPPLLEIPYERITDFDFQGGAQMTGGGFVGGGLGLTGAAEGIVIASVLNALTTKTEVNSLVRISAADGEIYLHHGAVLPDVLRMLFGPAVNAVSARGSAAKPGAQAIDPVDRLERLAKLRDAGILTQEEFDAAKAQIMRELI